MPQSPSEASVIKAYWQPGCTSCLRMKEFLTKHGVPFPAGRRAWSHGVYVRTAALAHVPVGLRNKFAFQLLGSGPSIQTACSIFATSGTNRRAGLMREESDEGKCA